VKKKGPRTANRFGRQWVAITMKPSVKFVLGASVAVAAFAFLANRAAEPEGISPRPMPPVLQQVQALGELHTARYTYQNVFEHRTAKEPRDWVRYVPGGASLVRATTENRALVEVHGRVEAGVDLGKAKMIRSADQSAKLVLPRAQVYRPDVDARIFDAKSGLMWRDQNLALKAVDAAKERLMAAATAQGIRDQAEKEAAKRVGSLLTSSGVNVTVAFE